MDTKTTQAKADSSHDGRFTHPSATPNFPEPTAYPKWVTPPGGKAVIVQNPDEEDAVLHPGKVSKKDDASKKEGGFVRLGALLLVTLAMLCGLAVPAFAQTTVTQTTLTNALAAPAQGSPATTVTLGSATGINTPTSTAPGSVLYFDREAVRVQSLVTSTTFTVQRGQLGTSAAAHAAGAIVFAGPSSGIAASPFASADPSGVCVAASQPYTLTINVRSGNVWACTATTSGAKWSSWSFVPDYPTLPRTVVAGNTSATTGGYTIVITDYVVALSTTGTGSGGVAAPVTTFTLPTPASGMAGKALVIKDESGGIGATTFINIMGTIDGATSAQLKTAYGSLTLYAGSGGWFTVGCYKAGCFQ